MTGMQAGAAHDNKQRAPQEGGREGSARNEGQPGQAAADVLSGRCPSSATLQQHCLGIARMLHILMDEVMRVPAWPSKH